MNRTNLLSYTVVKIAVVIVIAYLIQGLTNNSLSYLFALNPAMVYAKGFIWQIVTYLFLHASPLHLLINTYLLVMFGIQVEQAMGSGKMWFYFFFCGIGAGIIIFAVGLMQILSTGVMTSTIGASGAVFGIMIAFAFYYPDAEILLFFILPVKSKVLVFFYIAFEVYHFVTGTGGNISYIGHLGGIIFSLLYFLIWGTHTKGFVGGIRSKVKKKKLDKEKNESLQKEKEQKHTILKKLSGGLSLNDLTDDEYQIIKQFSIMYDESLDVRRSQIKNTEISDHQFISLVRLLTGRHDF